MVWVILALSNCLVFLVPEMSRFPETLVYWTRWQLCDGSRSTSITLEEIQVQSPYLGSLLVEWASPSWYCTIHTQIFSETHTDSKNKFIDEYISVCSVLCFLNDQALSPLSDGLFHRGIAESGTAAMPDALFTYYSHSDPLPIAQVFKKFTWFTDV